MVVTITDRAIPNPRRHYICMHEQESRPAVHLLVKRLLAIANCSDHAA
jgi:hypothetical protein